MSVEVCLGLALPGHNKAVHTKKNCSSRCTNKEERWNRNMSKAMPRWEKRCLRLQSATLLAKLFSAFCLASAPWQPHKALKTIHNFDDYGLSSCWIFRSADNVPQGHFRVWTAGAYLNGALQIFRIAYKVTGRCGRNFALRHNNSLEKKLK